jgi:hypothetical protein
VGGMSFTCERRFGLLPAAALCYVCYDPVTVGGCGAASQQQPTNCAWFSELNSWLTYPPDEP